MARCSPHAPSNAHKTATGKGVSFDTQADILTVRWRVASFYLPARDQLVRPHFPDIDAFGHLENLLHDLQAVSVWIQQQTTLELVPLRQHSHMHTQAFIMQNKNSSCLRHSTWCKGDSPPILLEYEHGT